MDNNSVKVEIKNLSQIRAAFKKAPDLMTKELNKAIKKTAFNVQKGEVNYYKGYGIQVITGGLIGSIERGVYFTNLKAEVGPNVTESPGVDYAGYVESGTYKMEGRPFLHAAILSEESNTDATFTEAVQNVLNNIGDMV